MRRAVATFLALIGLSPCFLAHAYDDGASAGGSGYDLTMSREQQVTEWVHGRTRTGTLTQRERVIAAVLDFICHLWGDDDECTGSDGGTAGRAVSVQTIVARAFRRIPLPESEIVIQPPGGRTLVNFDTLFRTEAHPVTRTVRLLGHRVQLRARPSSFVWRPGDGTVFTTTQPGRAYRKRLPMSSYVSHRYTEATSVRPRVDTTWSARFRVDGGPWRPVAGTVTIDGAPVELRVVEARAQLVAGR